jgi:phosphatidate cytidylyltransferase
VLRTRVWTALAALPILVGAILFAPPAAFTSLIAVFMLIGLYEIAAMATGQLVPGLAMVMPIGIVLACGVFQAPFALWWLPALTFIAMGVLVAAVARGGSGFIPHGRALAALGAVWVGVMFPYFVLLRNSGDGIALTVFLLLLVIVSDSAAYFAGRSLGRIKLAPRVSPNKTVEGALGAVAACAAAGLMLRAVLVPRWNMGEAVIFSLVVCLLAQIGDLTGSAIKRAAGVKDSGRIFPGHGGMLDRACSIVFAAAFTYYYSH